MKHKDRLAADQGELGRKYRALWAAKAEGRRPASPRVAECEHLGPTLERRKCRCPQLNTRACGIHGRCTTGDVQRTGLHCCITCPHYAPDERLVALRDVNVDLGCANTPGRTLNCSLIEWRGDLLMAYRKNWSNASLAMAKLDRATLQPTDRWDVRIRKLMHDRGGQEDPRLFAHGDRLHIAYTGVTLVRGKVLTRVCLAELSDDLRGGSTRCPAFPWDDGVSWEKNWAPFSHDGRLLAVQRVAPHRVVDMTGDVGETWETPHSPRWMFGEPRGGAGPVRVGDEYYHFFHGRCSRRAWNGWYTCGVYTFEAKPPFKVKRFARMPLLTPNPKDRPSSHLPHVVYPCGAVLLDGVWHVSYGYHDTWCRVASFDFSAVETQLE